MRLLSVIMNRALSIPGVRVNALSRITPGEGAWEDWRIAVRGPRVYFISPKGWTPGGRIGSGPSMTFDIPREDVTLQWEGDDVDKTREWGPDAKAAKGKPVAKDSPAAA